MPARSDCEPSHSWGDFLETWAATCKPAVSPACKPRLTPPTTQTITKPGVSRLRAVRMSSGYRFRDRQDVLGSWHSTN